MCSTAVAASLLLMQPAFSAQAAPVAHGIAPLTRDAAQDAVQGAFSTVPSAQAASAAPAVSATLVVTINVDSTFARVAPDWNAGLVGRLMKWDRFTAVGRNADAEWLHIDYGNSLVWIHQTMARFPRNLEGVENPLVLALPVTEKSGNLSPSRIRLTPIGVPVISARARQIYRQSAAAGRNPTLFTVAGDCNSEPPVYLGRFAAGGFDLKANGFGNLQSVATRFAKSFARHSLAVDGGHNAASAADPLFAHAEQCAAGEGPLACELRASQASVIFISLGTGDTFTWQDFEANYRRLIDTALQAGALPVLVTKADDLESLQGGAPAGHINGVIRRLGQEYQIPVMDFALAAKRLPHQGLADEGREIEGRGVVYLTDDRFHVNGYGMDMRMLMTLMTLSAIMR
jgi:hypothetical protein